MDTRYRNLTRAEIEQLERQGNMAEDWSAVFVSDPFCPSCLHGNTFCGTVRLGAVERATVCAGDLTIGEGISRSTLCDTTVGDHPAVHNVAMLSGYTLGDRVILFNIEEMSCTADSDRVAWLEPMNENGGRRIRPFAGMTIADAYMWARYRGHKTFVDRLYGFTLDALRSDKGRIGYVGDCCTIKNTKTIRNVTVRSCEDDKTCVDSCIALCDGVVDYGCKLEHGVIAMRFLLGEHVHLEMGLRLNDTVVGDNSTLARCEVGNSIIFPAHEQHHNNSFLIAALVMGQSNVAAGGTIGSNHNSRTPDGELAAARGFWPGLCCSFKHSSRFASYCLLAKGDYPAELDIRLPFALVNNNVAKDQLEVMPAYWWMYNMYALDRCSKKFAKRDKRILKAQHIEFDSMAPDTAEEMLNGITLLDKWIAEAKDGIVYAEGMENSKRPTVVLKAKEGREAYKDMLAFYAVKTLATTCGESLPPASLGDGERITTWVNIGGQIVASADMERLISKVENGELTGWQQVNAELDSLWQQYPMQKAAHAYKVLCLLEGVERIDADCWQRCLKRYADLTAFVAEQVKASRHKDDINPFRRMTYFDDAERDAVMDA